MWLDDVRQHPENFIRSHSAPSCIFHLAGIHYLGQRVTFLSLDHDLGEDSGTGYDVLLWIEEQTALDVTYHPPVAMSVHSDNAGARGKMLLAIQTIEKIYAQRLHHSQDD